MVASFQDLLGYIQAQEATLQALRCKSKSQILGLETLCEQSITNCIVLCNCRGCLFSNKIYCIGQVGKENCLPDGAAVRSTVTEAFEHFAATVDEHFDELVATQKLSLDAVFNSRAIRDKPTSRYGAHLA